ncbi:hypothetical protein ACFWUZ_12300 [Streptomyces sp. NPDC058646]|uniref:hypothetical protein n=1 Tax=Streptomyces sp. NPDC058646 TaxID=3346574 RepID=UPI0036676D37
MTLKEGQRVRLASDTRLIDAVAEADGAPAPAGAPTAFLSLAAGTEGTVERVVEHQDQSEGVREYVRLKSLLDAFGGDMPPESRRRLEAQVGSLEPEWIDYQQQGPLVTVRVRFDNGFVLDDVHEGLFAGQ